MKTRITVSWAQTVEVDVDPTKMEDSAYQDKVRNDAVKQAGADLNWREGMVTDCEDFPDLAE